jgi:hypothetical protein
MASRVNTTPPPLTAAGVGGLIPESALAVIRNTKKNRADAEVITCIKCHEQKSCSEFYAAWLKRSAFMCKQCASMHAVKYCRENLAARLRKRLKDHLKYKKFAHTLDLSVKEIQALLDTLDPTLVAQNNIMLRPARLDAPVNLENITLCLQAKH